MILLRFLVVLAVGSGVIAGSVSAAPPRVSAKKQEAIRQTSPFRLIVPAMGLDIPVARGIDNDALRRAPGYDPLSALPGQRGNCIVASHRNVHGAYFWYLTKITPGALITLQTPHESFDYRVKSAGVMPETQTEVLEAEVPPGAPPRLTLYTCTLPVSPRRYVVVADLVGRSIKNPGYFHRPTAIREITSGPLKLLKDPVLRARYRALLRYASQKPEPTPVAPASIEAKAAHAP